ncbi:acetylornithine transaminase [Streptomyces sp. NPDC047315]|uniref:acetylornithine transaminase n=1 Tax=Streptomyces sp. NPDC047315 TaxID=3155142 RepID=UPI0033FD3E06
MNPEPTATTPLSRRRQDVLTDTYGPARLSLERGEGCTVWDTDGNAYLDLLAGVAVNALGHAHPAVLRAVTEQAARLGHVSNLYATGPTVALAERLLALVGRPGRVFFANSGAEANETAVKLGRLTGRRHMVAAHGGFHGRTTGALALTGQPAKRAPFAPFPGEVTFVPYGDVAALAECVTDRTALLVLEPVQGENGVVVPPPGYLRAAREITARTGTLLVLDEVQTGIGRTGHWFACQAEGVTPDVITLAKGLGGGLPIGAALALGPAADLFTPGSHGSTFGGNPVVCAAALAVLDTVEDTGLLDHVKRVGEELRRGIEALGHPLVDHVRGAGLLLGVVLTAPLAARVEHAAQQAGLLVNAAVPDVVRLTPPLVIGRDEVAAVLDRLPAVLDRAQRAGG